LAINIYFKDENFIKGDKMKIANPIYDVVFKYLMEDSKIAKLLISTIIGEKILALEFLPQEKIVEFEYRSLTVYRLDFSAKIKTDTGHKNVLIEIQKAKFATDIMRFRKYLGEQYQKKENVYRTKIQDKELKKAMPILSIYFLGHKLEHITVPIIKAQRRYYDVTTGDEITKKEEFIESLTHDSFIIQIPQLRKKYQTEVEQLLSVFDQRNATLDSHILNVNEEDFPEKYRSIIRRLQKAIVEPDMRDKMDIEDEIVEELQELERELEKKEERINEDRKIIAEKDKTITEKDKNLAEKDKRIEERDKALEEKERSIAEKDKIIEELREKLTER